MRMLHRQIQSLVVRIPVQSAQLHLLLLALVVSLVVQVALLTVRILVQSMVTSLLRMVISVVLSVGWIRATSLSTTRAIVHCLIHVLLEQTVLQRLVALSVSTVTMIAAQVRVAVVRLGATSLMTIAMRSGMVCFWVTSGQLIQLFWVLRMSLSSFLVVA